MSRIEVTPATVVLTAAGQTHPLTAKAFDANGNEVQAILTWNSVRPAQVTVDAAGTVRAVTDIGSAAVYAEAQGIHSRATLVSTVTAKPGAVLLTDAQIIAVGDYFTPDGGADDFRGQVDVRLRNVAPPAPGTVVLGTETVQLAGVVVSAQSQGGETVARLESVPLPQLLDRYDFDYTLPLTDYDIVVDGAESNATAGGLPVQRRARYETRIEKRFPPSDASPFSCELVGSANFSGKLLSVNLNGDAQLVYKNSKDDPALPPGYLKLALEGPLTLKGTMGLTAEAGLEGSITCELKGRIPVFLPFAISPAIPIGVGISIEGKLIAAKLDLSLSGENGFDFGVGFECGPAAAPCHMLSQAAPINRLTPNIKVPDEGAEGFRAEITAKAYFLSGLDLVFVGGLYNLGIVKATLGPVQTANLALPKAQANDRGYASDYELKVEGKLEPGTSVAKAIKALIGEEPASLGLQLVIASKIAESPKATMTVDKTSVAPHEDVHFNIDIEPATLEYPLLGVNAEEMHIYRKRSDDPQLFESMATVPVTSLRTTWTWTPQNDDLGENEFFAFVKTKMPVVLLEVAKDSSRRVDVVGICSAFLARKGAGLPQTTGGGGCTVTGTMSHRLIVDDPTTQTQLNYLDTASVNMQQDTSQDTPGLIFFKPYGTWNATRSGTAVGCTLQFPNTGGSLDGDPSQGYLVVYVDDQQHADELYAGIMATGMFQVHQQLVCPDQTIPNDSPQDDQLFKVSENQNLVLDGGVATGTYTEVHGTTREIWDWNLVVTDPSPPPAAR